MGRGGEGRRGKYGGRGGGGKKRGGHSSEPETPPHPPKTPDPGREPTLFRAIIEEASTVERAKGWEERRTVRFSSVT